MQRAYRDAMETKVAKETAEREEEEEMRRIMMAKFAGGSHRYDCWQCVTGSRIGEFDEVSL